MRLSFFGFEVESGVFLKEDGEKGKKIGDIVIFNRVNSREFVDY